MEETRDVPRRVKANGSTIVLRAFNACVRCWSVEGCDWPTWRCWRKW